jgi:hypothetical protein
MNFMDSERGSHLEFPMPHGLRPPVSWAAFGGYAFLPVLIDIDVKAVNKYRVNDDGRREILSTTSHHWQMMELHVFNMRSPERAAFIRDVVPGDVYLTEAELTDIKEKPVAFDQVSVAPVSFSNDKDGWSILPYTGEGVPDFAIAATRGSDVYYAAITNIDILLFSHKKADSRIQSVIFTSAQDVIVSEKTLYTTRMGNIHESIQIPSTLKPLSGSPAIYGDIIFVVNQAGTVAAIGT